MLDNGKIANFQFFLRKIQFQEPEPLEPVSGTETMTTLDKREWGGQNLMDCEA